jgi:hypothetical protein
MTRRKSNPKNRKEWPRVPNTGPGRRVGNKYNFSQVLKKVGDFVQTHSMSYEDMTKIKFAAYIWAYRKHCRIRTEILYYPDGYGLHIEVMSATRKTKSTS